jgi:hypothetical protein
MAWTNEQVERMVQQHFRADEVACPSPSCAGPVDVQEQGASTRNASVELTFSCAKCGGQARRGKPPAPSTEWTDAQKEKMFDDYAANNFATCPVDRAQLTIGPFPAPGGRQGLNVSCRQCGRLFSGAK